MRVTSQEFLSKAKLKHKLHPATQETKSHQGKKLAGPHVLLAPAFGGLGRYNRGPFRAPLYTPLLCTSSRENSISARIFLSLNALFTAKPDHLQVAVPLEQTPRSGRGNRLFDPPEVLGTPQGPQQTGVQAPAGDLGEPRRGPLLCKRQETTASSSCGETQRRRRPHSSARGDAEGTAR